METESRQRAGNRQGVFRSLLTPPFRLFWNVSTEGLENVPSTGGAIIAPNHVSVIDSFVIPLTIPRRITYVGKAEYMDDWKTRWLFPAMGMVPIDRSGGDSAQAALDTAARVLEFGELFCIYPEGTRSRSGELHKGHTGVARLALRTNAPIIPVGIIGSADVQPPGSVVPKPFGRMHLRFGRPIDVSRYQDRAGDRLILRQIADEVMYEIRNLSGQEYVDSYATKPSKPAVGPETIPEPDRVPEPVVPETEPGIAPVIQLPTRATPAEVGIPDIAAGTGIPVSAFSPSAVSVLGEDRPLVRRGLEGDERRSSASVLKVRPLEPA